MPKIKSKKYVNEERDNFRLNILVNKILSSSIDNTSSSATLNPTPPHFVTNATKTYFTKPNLPSVLRSNESPIPH